MKHLIFFVIFLSILQVRAKLDFDPQYSLYTSAGLKYRADQAREALDQAFSYGKPVIIYIHGRGDEPLKSIQGKPVVGGATVPLLEKDYGARVLLFNWDAQGFGLDRDKPLAKIPTAAQNFALFMDQVRSYDLNGRKLILHAHSMGTIVIQKYVESRDWTTAGHPIFSNIIFTEPDADNVGHARWIDRIALRENLYITTNADDLVLGRSTDSRPRGAAAIGLVPHVGQSKFAIYLDYTDISDRPFKSTGVHEIFDKSSMKNQLHVCRVLHGLFTGQRPNFTEDLKATDAANYYKFKFKLGRGDCF